MSTFNPSFGQYIKGITNTPGSTGGVSIVFARVVHVVRGPYLVGTTTRDSLYRDPSDLGIITYQTLTGPQDRTSEGGNITARPMLFGFKQYPLEGEIVYIIPGPSIGMNDKAGEVEYYYFPPYNMWSKSHHNAFPHLGNVQNYTSNIDRSYQNSQNTRQPVNTSVTGGLIYPLGPNFPEKPNIRPLRQFTGDVTLEGRWGNSIRLGSTTFTDTKENSWSPSAQDRADVSGSIQQFGKPITIIRNGQAPEDTKAPFSRFFPTVEDINKDPSSIYLTEGQKIQITDIEKNFSLASLNVSIEIARTVTIPIQQQLTSTDTTSAQQQDNITREITNPNLS